MKRILLCWGLGTAFLLGTLHGQDMVSFDKNRSGTLEPAERQAYFIHRNSATFRELDTDFDGHLSAAEIKKLEEKEVQTASLDEVSWERKYSGKNPAAPSAELGAMFPDMTKEPLDTLGLWHVQIRRSLADVDPRGKYKETTPPATFSYQRDFNNGSDAWTAKGVVARPFVFDDVGSSSFIPSFEFDRFSHAGDPADERDSLIFRLGSDIGLRGDSAGNRLRMNAAFKTDSGLRERTWAGEVEWETSYGPLGGFHPLGHLPVAWYPRAYPRAEFGTRSDNRDLLTADEKDFFRAGPVLALQLTPYFQKGWDHQFIVSLEYAYLLSLKGDRGARNFAARFDWTLDPRGHLKLGVEYRKGALTLEERGTKSLTVGLGIAF